MTLQNGRNQEETTVTNVVYLAFECEVLPVETAVGPGIIPLPALCCMSETLVYE